MGNRLDGSGKEPSSPVDPQESSAATTQKSTASKSKSDDQPDPTDQTPTKNLEPFVLVWLDSRVNEEGNRRMQKRINEVHSYLLPFDDFSAFEEYLKESLSEEKIVLIVGGRMGVQNIDKIEHYKQIIAIHVYCLDVQRNKGWTSKHAKVHSVVSNPDELLKQISKSKTLQETIEEAHSIRLAPAKASIEIKDPVALSLLWYRFFLDFLLSSEYFAQDKSFDRLISVLRDYSGNDEHGKKLIAEFRQKYRPEDAIDWLTRDHPLSTFVNRALRQRDLSFLFSARFFLFDVYNCLRKEQVRSVTAYRYTLLSREQMENMKAKPGVLLMVDSFCFASTSKPKLEPPTNPQEPMEPVLLKFDAKSVGGATPFTIIDKNVKMGDAEATGETVLFMSGSVFQVEKLVCENSTWTATLTLISEYDIPAYSAMKQKYEASGPVCFITDLLHQCGELEKAITFNHQFRSILPENHGLRPRIRQNIKKSSKIFPSRMGC